MNTTRANEPADSTNTVGSLRWTVPDGDAGQELGRYLDELAALPEVREVGVRALQLLGLRPGNRVLELGCGTGAFLPVLADAVGPDGCVVGLDRSSEFVTAARARMAGSVHEDALEIHQGDAHHLPFADASFDAAHCERLLMHLEDPKRVLREMCRVVRPGGRIVAAEPHWQGAQLDHPDTEAIELLITRWRSGIRHPRMGLELNRRFAEAGLIERQVSPVFVVPIDAARFVRYGLDFRACADELVWECVMTPQRAEAAVKSFEQSSHETGFCGYIAMFIVAGRVPEPGAARGADRTGWAP